MLHKKEALEIDLRLSEEQHIKDLKSWITIRDQLSQLEVELAIDPANTWDILSTTNLRASSSILDSMATKDNPFVAVRP